MPSTWVLNSVVWDDSYVIGASLPGLPNVSYGRNKHLAWSHTTPVHDGVDLWTEELNEERTHYRVDGEWREVKKIIEQIWVKMERMEKFEVSFTHRGPLVDFDTLKSGFVSLFGAPIPSV